jgi:pSer/pThr/pTyr-binding forkhead associated (FHA) protein
MTLTHETLAIYQGNQTYKITYEPGKTWCIGRSPKADIQIIDPAVSRAHVLIEGQPLVGDVIGWFVRHVGSNPARLIRGIETKALPRGEWVLIKDGDVVEVVYPQHALILTTDTNDTLEIPLPTEPPPEQAPPPVVMAPQGLSWPDVVAVILQGPPGLAPWLWWVFLFTLVLLGFYIWRITH